MTQHIQDCSVELPLETKRFIDTISIVYTNLVFKSGNFVEDKQTYKGIIAQNANGIIIMYPVRSMLQRSDKDKANPNSVVTYCSQNFYPFNKFKIHIEQKESELQQDQDLDFLIVESYQWVNNFSTLSEQNLSQFIDIAEEVLQNDQRSCPNFGITDNQQKNKNLILI